MLTEKQPWLQQQCMFSCLEAPRASMRHTCRSRCCIHAAVARHIIHKDFIALKYARRERRQWLMYFIVTCSRDVNRQLTQADVGHFCLEGSPGLLFTERVHEKMVLTCAWKTSDYAPKLRHLAARTRNMQQGQRNHAFYRWKFYLTVLLSSCLLMLAGSVQGRWRENRFSVWLLLQRQMPLLRFPLLESLLPYCYRHQL